MISELPRSRSGPPGEVPDDLGVSHREIIWRSDGVRPVARPPWLPGWLDPLVLLLVIGYLLGGIAAAPLSLEEAVQLSLTNDAAVAVSHPGLLVPGAQGSTPSTTEESVRLAYGSITRYSAALGWYASGGNRAQAPIDLTVPVRSRVRVPSWNRVVAARTGPAVLAVIAVLVIFALTRRLFGRTASLIAVVIFGLHPTVALISRQSVDAGLTLMLGLASILVALRISATVTAGVQDVELGTWMGLAILVGLTLASGPTALPYVAGAAAFCLAGLLGRERRRRRELVAGRVVRSAQGGSPVGWVAASALAAVLVWVAVSPALWGWLPERLGARHDARVTLVAERLMPDPGPDTAGARLRVAAGILTEPFLTPAHLDRGVRLEEYQHSWWSGLPLGTSTGALPSALTALLSGLLGLILTAAGAVGVVALWRRSRLQAAAIYCWGLATVGWLIIWPSVQVDHGVPFVALACVLVAASVPLIQSRVQAFLPARLVITPE